MSKNNEENQIRGKHLCILVTAILGFGLTLGLIGRSVNGGKSTSQESYQVNYRTEVVGLAEPTKKLIQMTAREHGISEEEARQAYRNGGLKGGYTEDEVNRVFGK
jgi:hypothetical protein